MSGTNTLAALEADLDATERETVVAPVVGDGGIGHSGLVFHAAVSAGSLQSPCPHVTGDGQAIPREFAETVGEPCDHCLGDAR